MERHRCKLCHRRFANGRALGGHMKAHLATLPLPPKAKTETQPICFEDEEEKKEIVEQQQQQQDSGEAEEDKALGFYGLRENPKKSLRFADSDFSFAALDAGSVVHETLDADTDTDQTTESSKKPTRRRSKRTRRPREPRALESPPASSVSDASAEEDVAMCLMMLSRDVWSERRQRLHRQPINGAKRARCDRCDKAFRTHQAMCSHKKICLGGGDEEARDVQRERVFRCPYCCKVFGSGQALGGHKRSHQLTANAAATSTTSNSAVLNNRQRDCLIDLNLPAPLEEDDFSVVSDA